MNVTSAQTCNELNKDYFGGLITEAPDNFDDIALLLSVSVDFFADTQNPSINDAEPSLQTLEGLSFVDILKSDIAPQAKITPH